MDIKIKYLSKDVKRITINPKGDWIDLYASEHTLIPYNTSKLVPLGITVALPEGYEGHLLPRSSTFKTWGILMANSMGIIDNSYCGEDDEWKFPAFSARPRLYERFESDMHPSGYVYEAVPLSKNMNIYSAILEGEPNYVDGLYDIYDKYNALDGVYFFGSIVSKGDKICQFRVVEKMPPINLIEVDTMPSPSRGGFGSTGSK